MLEYIQILRPPALMIYLTTIMAGLATGRQITDILFTTLAVFFISLGLYSLDDIFDERADKVAHPNRLIPSGVLPSSTLLRIAICSLSASIIISFIKLSLFYDVILPVMVCGGVALGIIVVSTHRIIKSNVLQALAKMGMFGALVFLLFLTAGGFNEKIIVLGIITGLVHMANTIILDFSQAKGDEFIGYVLPGSLIYAAGLIHLTGAFLIWIPYYLNLVHRWCLIPITSMFICFITLSVACFVKKIDRVRMIAGLGKASMFVLLLIETLNSLRII